MIIHIGIMQGLFSFIPYSEPVSGVDFKNSCGFGHLGITASERPVTDHQVEGLPRRPYLAHAEEGESSVVGGRVASTQMWERLR